MNNFLFREDMEFITDTSLPWDKFNNKTILIAGANGLLPAYMLETFLYLNDEKKLGVFIIALVRDKRRAMKRFEKYKHRNDIQLLQQDIVNSFDIKEKIHFIIHAASQASPKYYHNDPVGTLLANVQGTYHLLELAKKHEVEHFLYFSSGEVYGEVFPSNRPINETMYGILDPLDIRSSYGESKRMGENMCIAYAHQFGLSTKIVRPYHTYGPGLKLDDGRVFADFVADIVLERDIVIHGDGCAIRSFCYLADATSGFFTVLLKGNNSEAYNVGNPNCVLSIAELANKLLSLFPNKHLKIVKKPRLNTDNYMKSKVEISYPDITKIKKLGWSPEVSVEKGFKKTVESFYELA